MPRTTITPIMLSREGEDLATTETDDVNGNQIPISNDENILFSFFSISPCTVTVLSSIEVDSSLVVGNRVLVLSSGVVKLWLCDIPSVYRQADGNIYLNSTSSCAAGIYSV